MPMTQTTSPSFKRNTVRWIMNTQRCGNDLVAILVARDPNQDLDSIPNLDLGVQNMVGCIMDPFIFFLYGTLSLVGLIIIIYWYTK